MQDNGTVKKFYSCLIEYAGDVSAFESVGYRFEVRSWPGGVRDSQIP